MSTTSAAPHSIFAPALRATTGGIVLVVTLLAFESMAVSAALPTAARDLHGLGAYGWAFTGFLVANVVGMVVSGQVSDAYGARVPLTAGLVAFVGGLLVSGTATTMGQLVIGRVVQGLGGGLLITALYVVIGGTYPGALSAKVFAATSSAWVLPSIIGPLVAGALAQDVSWRWVFLGLLPFVLLGAGLLVPVLRAMTHVRPVTRAAHQWRRILSAFAVALGIAALEAAGQHPRLASLVAAGCGLVALIWGLRVLLPAGTALIRPGVAAPVAFRGLLAGSFFGVESLVPLSLSVQHHYSPTAAAVPLMIGGPTWALGSWWQGRGRTSRVRLIRIGFALIAAAAGLVAFAVPHSAPGVLVYPAWGLAGLGAGLAMSSVSVLLLEYTTEADRGTDSAALQISDAVSSAVTTGIAGVLVAAAARGVLGYTPAFVTVDLAMAAIAVVGFAAAGRARAVAP